MSVMRWSLKDSTAITLEGDYLHNRHPLHRGVTRYASQQGRLSAPGRLLLLAKGSYKPHSRRSDATHSPYRPRLLELKSVWQISIMF
ncbi:hypothetical protein IPC20_19460 [Pseudomonas aeruginosa]|nr:hypothetical protein IPC20_19460 [Pseudomonas aeruginosa]